MASNTLDFATRREGDTLRRTAIPTTPTRNTPVHDTSSPHTYTKPVLFVVDADPVLRRGLTAALKR